MNDDEKLSEYLDGRLDAAAKAAFEERIRAEPELARAWRLMRAEKAALAASAPPMPSDLKAALLREARLRTPKRDVPWTEYLSGITAGTWLTGAGAAAFAAAVITVMMHRPPAVKPPRAPVVPAGPITGATWTDPAAANGLDTLWTADDGGENDEG